MEETDVLIVRLDPYKTSICKMWGALEHKMRSDAPADISAIISDESEEKLLKTDLGK